MLAILIISVIPLAITNLFLICCVYKLVSRKMVLEKANSLDEVKDFDKKRDEKESEPEEIISIDQALKEGLIEIG